MALGAALSMVAGFLSHYLSTSLLVCLFNPRRILTESEIQEVITLYQLYCQSCTNNLKNHYDFLIKTSLKLFNTSVNMSRIAFS